MLGEKIGEEHGKITGTRILQGDDYRYLKMEMSFQASGTLLGQQAMDMGTFTAFERVPNQIYGEGRGILLLATGESAIWNGHGVGRMTGQGMAMSFRAAIAYQAGQGKLERLNHVMGMIEFEVDENGNTHAVLHEWK
ncbi:MAG: hypothetical protein HYU30_02755 [Chloroflexi bacterium]|nr:hypothetical protein [Chloroflexota bacterium]MBI4198287.1 hypothetical protein [Chloroflexota bacterium]